MGKHKYQVYYTVTLETSRVIAAESEGDAKRIADELRYDPCFHEGLMHDMESDCEGWRSKNITFELDCQLDDDEPADNEGEQA